MSPTIRLRGATMLAALTLAACDTSAIPTAVTPVSVTAAASLDGSIAPFIRTGIATRRIGDINDLGEVAFTSQDRRMPAVWSAAGGVRPLEPNGRSTTPWTITNDGVVGGIDDGAGVVWTDAGRVVVATDGTVEDITETGMMAGADGVHPAIWKDGTTTTFELPDGYIYGFFSGVSDAGYAAGTMQAAAGGLTGIFWNGGTSLVQVPAVAGRTHNVPVDVNAAGQVVGWATTFGSPGGDAFVYENGVVSVLAPLPGAEFSAAQRITEDGLIIGTSANLPVVWLSGSPVSLPLPEGASGGNLVGVNEVGQAVGYVNYPPGVTPRLEMVIWNLHASGLAALRALVVAAVADGEITSRGVANALMARLDAATDALARGDRQATRGALTAFRQHVEALTGKHVPGGLAARLLPAASLATP